MPPTRACSPSPEQTAGLAPSARSSSLTRRLQGGIAPRTDLRQAETILDQARSDVAISRTALAQDINALQLLVGAPIDPASLPGSIEEVAATLSELPAGLDSGILLRRPDVVQAEYQLRAANAQIGAARAALFPRISLTAVAGFASTSLASLFDGNAFSWSVSPGASYSIFDFGAARAGVAESRAAQQAALATYERAIQSAFREVADALARRGTIDEQERADSHQVEATTDNLPPVRCPLPAAASPTSWKRSTRSARSTRRSAGWSAPGSTAPPISSRSTAHSAATA